MKALLAVLALAAVALLAYNYVHTGRLALVPSSLPRGEQQLRQLEEQLDAARRQLEAAGRAAGTTGVRTSAEAEAARREVDRIEAQLRDLRDKLEESAKGKAEALQHKIDEFKKDLR